MLYLTDKDGNLYGSQDNSRITYTKIDGVETWYEYDDRGNCSRIRSDDKNEYWEYDDQNRWIHHIDEILKFEEWRGFDDYGNIIYHHNRINEQWYDYDDNHRLIHKKYKNIPSQGCLECWYIYDKDGNNIVYVDNAGYCEIAKYSNDGVMEYWRNHNTEQFVVYKDDESTGITKVYGLPTNIIYEYKSKESEID